MLSAIITNIIQEINYARELEAEAEEIWQNNRTSHISSVIDLAEEDARLERKYNAATAKSFIEELGSQEWQMATKLSDQMIKELRQHFSMTSFASINEVDDDGIYTEEDI